MVSHSGVEAFLTICRAKSISRAAEELFVSQSSLSVRLRTLENELGTTLLLRKKGQREIALTKSGKEFYEIALDYEKVINRIERMRKQHEKKLNVSSVNSLGTYILPECYELFMEKHPDVSLEIQEQEFREACKSILQGRTDLAFNTSKNVPDRLGAMPAFSEDCVLICSEKSAYPETVSAHMLNIKNEIYVNWYNGFDAFHASVFGNDSPQLRLDMMSQLEMFIKKPNAWAIVPASVAQGLAQSAGICILKTDFALPKRVVYCIHSAEYEMEEHSILFLKCLKEILLQKQEAVCLLPQL